MRSEVRGRRRDAFAEGLIVCGRPLFIRGIGSKPPIKVSFLVPKDLPNASTLLLCC